MKNLLVIIILMISFSLSYGQKERSYNRTGVKDYMEGDYNNAELDFMKALEYDSTSFAANYNTASTLYKLGKYAEANEILAKLANTSESPEHLPDMLHNLGNNFMKQEMYDKSIEAYKNSLRLRPDDDDTRYNLGYAQAKLKQQQEQEKEDNKDNKDKDNKDNKDKDKQDEKNKDEKQDKEDQEQEQDQEQQQQNQDEKKDQQQAQETKELSKEDVERILQAIQEQEKDVKEKVDKEKAKVKKVKTEKDW